jgi:hypothetical protein
VNLTGAKVQNGLSAGAKERKIFVGGPRWAALSFSNTVVRLKSMIGGTIES